MLFSRPTLRRLAVLALLSWAFATASGLAHACGWLGDAAGATGIDAVAMTSMAGHDHAAMGHGDAGMSVDDEGTPPASQPLCAKFCDSDKASMPEVRLALDPALQVLVTAWTALTLSDRAALAARARPGESLADNRSSQDIPIAFLRLTL